MKRTFTITLDGIEYPVEAEGETITINNRSFTVEVEGDGAVLVDGIAYSVLLDGETAQVGDDSYSIKVSGLAAVPAPSPSAAEPAAPIAASAGAVLAIMPGKIVRVMVEPGQAVEEGDPVCILEAMKMENELHAPKSGTVEAVHVGPGDDVEKDQVLVEIG